MPNPITIKRILRNRGDTFVPYISPLLTNLVAAYNFDWNTFDLVGNNSGTESGGYSYVAGKIDRGFDLSGTGTYMVNSSADFDFLAGEFAISIWVKRLSAAATNPAYFVAKSGPVAGARKSFFVGFNNKKLEGGITNGVGTNFIITGATTVNDTNWHNVVFQRKVNLLEVYLDGVLDGSLNIAGQSVNSTAFKFSFGSLGEYVSVNFAGTLDAAYIWKGKYLSSGEIAELNLGTDDSQYPFGSDLAVYAFFGDSITVGYNASPHASGWAYLLGKAKGKMIYNAGVYHTTVAQFIASGAAIPAKNPNLTGQKIFFAWGVNDQVTTTTAQYKIDYQVVINLAIAAGWAVSDMIIISGYYINIVPFPGYPAFITAAQQVASANGITEYNLFPLAYNLSDLVHPSTTGHASISTYLTAQIL